jgi:YfiH family protein
VTARPAGDTPAPDIAGPAADREPIADFSAFGVRAFTTTRAAGSFALDSGEPVRDVIARWRALQAGLRGPVGADAALATAHQVHGRRVLVHSAGWSGWLRHPEADGHASASPGLAMAVTIADCVPVFIAHPSGAIALLHAGWRGTETKLVAEGIAALRGLGAAAGDLRVHLGPAICARCYEVGPEVYARLTGRTVDRPTTVDLRALLADQARAAGVARIEVSPFCTRCDNDRFFSHRAGDWGRQLAVLVSPP